jgi:cell division septal protein FtsQ
MCSDENFWQTGSMTRLKRITLLGLKNWLGKKFLRPRRDDLGFRSKIWFTRKPVSAYSAIKARPKKMPIWRLKAAGIYPLTLSRLRYAKYFIVPAILLAIYVVFWSGLFTLNKLEITGNHLVTNSEIEKMLFPRGFKRVNAATFVSSWRTRKLRTVPQISNARVVENIFQKTLRIEIDEHQTSVIWQTAGERFFVNRFGVIYDHAADSSPLMVVEDLKNVPVSLNQKIVDPAFLEFVTSFSANLPRKTNITVRRITIPETTFEAEMITADGWRIILDTTKSYEEQLNNLVRVLREMGDQRPREYVDLRILDRVFWK